MGGTSELGRRIELVPMDPHFENITIALYTQAGAKGSEFLVHSYSPKAGVAERLQFVEDAMVRLGGMERTGEATRRLRFPCGGGHWAACRRVFLEACKQNPGAPLAERPLSILDKKSGRNLNVSTAGPGSYRVDADGEIEGKQGRISAVAAGLAKLAEMELVEGESGAVRFSCGRPHDALIGLLLGRALNVRAVLREEEMSASRGVLSAPSAQKE
ncbi:MAG: hypothetical protein AB1898_21785 [Acidobacteriota bacterium]